MSALNRLLDRWRPKSPDDDTRKALERTEQILAHIERQAPEVQRHGLLARRAIKENELAPKIRAALREAR